jgi:3-oxoacyl-[acyl-carrier-protein] synthase II
MAAGARVAVTGVGLASPIGHDLRAVTAALRERRGGIVVKPEWGEVGYLETRLAGEVRGLELSGYPRKKVRGMGRVSLLGLYATEQALADAGLQADGVSSPDVGLAYGSTHGSSSALIEFVEPLLANRSFRGIPSSAYLKFMSHTCAANLAQYYGILGRVIPTAAACVSSSLAVGYGFETIRAGAQDVMICGGAEELHYIPVGVFDVMMATSRRYNDRPDQSPRPFDAARDGLVVAEGAATLVLEGLDHARRRGARVYAEVVGFGTNCDGSHLTSPSATGMAGAMRLALRDAGIGPEALDYINAHATATEVGDIAESQAMADVLGPAAVPVSSTKGYTGHTLGACGSIEAAFCLTMMAEGFVAPNLNLDEVDPRCAPLDYVRGEPREAALDTVMSNSFAFGGINASLIFKRL